MNLSLYLKRAGVTTGPLVKNTSHSGLEVIKKALLGQPQFKGGEEFLIFGSALHERWLESKASYSLSKEQLVRLHKSLKALAESKEATALLKGATVEEKLKVVIDGVEVSFILDIHKKLARVGADLKSSGVRSLNDFIEKAKEYGYFRQARTYELAAKLKRFYFIAVTKEDTPRVFVFCTNDHPEEMRYANEELKFLLYFYKNYGTITTK